MAGSYILAHDLGTSGDKATLFDAEGRYVAGAFVAYGTDFPQAHWAEQDAHAWWGAVCDSTRRLLAESGVAAGEIAAVGFSGTMMGCLPVDAAGNPLRSCIIWADQRARAEAEWMADRVGALRIYARCGNRVSAAFSGPKMLWVREHQPEIFERTAKFLVPKDYIAQRLGAGFVTDYSDASGTLLFDLATRQWDAEILDALGLDGALLPEAHPSPDVVGAVTAAAAAETGLAAGTPIVIGGGDGSCAGAGAGVIDAGSCYCVIGTSAWVSVTTTAPVLDGQQRTQTHHHVHPDRYAPMGVQQMAGGAREWAWRALASESSLDLDEAAAQVAPGSEGLVFLPYLMGERAPWWNPLARGAFVGLTMRHGKPEMARAVLEGVAIGLRQIFTILRGHVPTIDAVRLIGGGGRSRQWPQILADCFDVPIHLLELKGEATSWGAAVVAGVGVGLYDWSIAAERARVVEVIEPDAARAACYAERAALHEDLYRALEPLYGRLTAGIRAEETSHS